MSKFIDYIYERNFFDLEDSACFFIEANEEQIKDYKPKDGKWSGLTYYFNVEEDPCGSKGDPCYKVMFGGSDNDPRSPISIAFQRAYSYGESDKDVPGSVLLGVQKAVYEYILKHNPAALRWSPVVKSGTPPKKIDDKFFASDEPPCPKGADGQERCRSRDEKYRDYLDKWGKRREKIYDNLTKQALFPNRYVSFAGNTWVRRDLYEKLFVKHGYPKLPENLSDDSSPSDKAKVLQDMRNAYKSGSQDNIALNNAIQQDIDAQRIEEERLRKEEKLRVLQSLIEDETQNPQKLKIGDTVALIAEIDDLKDSSTTGNFYTSWRMNNLNDESRFRIVGFEKDSRNAPILVAEVDEFDESSQSFLRTSYEIPVRDLAKETDNRVAEIARKKSDRLRDMLSNRDFNPNSLAVGDEVVFDHSDPRDKYFGLVGKVEKIRIEKVSDYVGHWVEVLRPVFAIAWQADRSLFPEMAEVMRLASRNAPKSFWIQTVRNTGRGPSGEFIARSTVATNDLSQIKMLTPQAVEDIKAKKSEAVGISAAEAAKKRLDRQGDKENRLKARIDRTMQSSSRYIDVAGNPEGIKPGDEVTIKTGQESDADGVGLDWSERNVAGRKGVVLEILSRYDDTIIAVVQINRSTIEARIRVKNLKKQDDSAAARRRQQAERRTATRQAITSGNATRGYEIGDLTNIQSGPHAGKRGRIISWRFSNNNYYASIETMVTPQNPTGGRVSVNVRLLEPSPRSNQTAVPATESGNDNPFGFRSFMDWRSSYIL